MESVLAGIDAQIADLERLILEKERWEIREEKREDTLAEEGRLGRHSPQLSCPVVVTVTAVVVSVCACGAGTYEAAAGGVELKKVTMLVGAERERQQLESLLIQRARYWKRLQHLC